LKKLWKINAQINPCYINKTFNWWPKTWLIIVQCVILVYCNILRMGNLQYLVHFSHIKQWVFSERKKMVNLSELDILLQIFHMRNFSHYCKKILLSLFYKNIYHKLKFPYFILTLYNKNLKGETTIFKCNCSKLYRTW